MNIRRWFGILLFGCFILPAGLFAQDEAQNEEFPNKEENALCLKCHGNQVYPMPVDGTGETVLLKMCRGDRIDTVAYYKGNHGTFTCTDCHSYDYTTFPHNPNLRLEQMPSCLDCHDGDPAVEKYHFESIDEEYRKSGHANLDSTLFSCWSCHNPHSFRLAVRTDINISALVKYDNSMCLNCHVNPVNPDYYLGGGLDLIVAKHTWLPKTENHFRNVRCIECHAKINENVLVPHNIVKKEDAVKRCVECHSTDSRLLHTLYKYQPQQARQTKGLVNSVISGQGYVVGANRSILLNRIGIVLVICTILGIGIHTTIRIIMK